MVKLYSYLIFIGFIPVFLGADSKICLTMIVKNDGAVLERSLQSVKEIIDCVAICDLGSTDNTESVAQKFLQENSIPGKFFHHQWSDFGFNRTLAAKAGQTVLQECGYNLSEAYLLVLDADMVVDRQQNFTKHTLQADAYMLPAYSSTFGLYHYAPYLLRASLPWQSVGKVAEFWLSADARSFEKLNTLMINDQGDGGLKFEKQDRRRFQEVLESDPNNPRIHFYLAQILKNLKEFDQAIQQYQIRLNKGGDTEEIWFSKYMLGCCYEEKGEWKTALHWYLEAYQEKPQRSEPFLKLATYYRFKSKNDLAYLFAKQGAKVKGSDQILFDRHPLAFYRFNEELSIASYYTAHREAGFNALNALILTRNVPGHVKNQAYRNLIFYTTPLKNATLKPLLFLLPFIKPGSEERYHPMNPSIIKSVQGYDLILRSVNYTQKGAIPWFFNTIDPEGVFRTRNFLIQYDKNFNIISQGEITENLPRLKIGNNLVQGLEDCRLFSDGQNRWFTCTTADTNPTGQRQISLCKLSSCSSGGVYPVESLLPLRGPDLNRCEKNWLPFLHNGSLCLIYSYDPLTLFKPNMCTGDCEMILQHESLHDFSNLRGSAAPIPWNFGYLMLVHEIASQEDHSRVYFHRFIYLNQDFKIEKMSKPFIFKKHGIEFCLSMTLDHSQQQLILPIGIEDYEAFLCFVDVETVQSLLEPLPERLH